jgi:hypothetical protein
MAKKGKTRLKDLVVNEVSLVDKGANGKRFLLTKAAEPAPETVMDTETPEAPPAETVEKAEEAAPAVEAEAAPAEVAAEPVEKAEVAAEPAPAAEPAAEEVAKALQAEAIQKAVAEAVEKAVAETKAQAAAERAVLEKRLADEQEAKEVSESIQKAASAFKNLPAKADVLGPDLRKIRKAVGDEVADRIESLLKGLDMAVKPALEPVGVAKAEETEASAWATIEKRAKTVSVQKSITFAQAVTDVLTDDPKLYAAYEAEKTQR